MDFTLIAVVALFILGFGLVSTWMHTTIFTPPMVYVAFGMLISTDVLNIIELSPEDELVRTLAEITLALVLFTDASRIDLMLMRRQYHLSMRMLGIGLPMTIILGGLVATVLFDQLTLWEAALAAAILAPTDAALGQAVVTSKKVPVQIRQTLNVESGLNDGIMVPVVTILLALASLEGESESVGFWLEFTGRQIILGPIVGIAVGYLGGRALSFSMRHMGIDENYQRLSGLAFALLAFAGAEVIGGNGFIAAFVAGLTIGNTARNVCNCMYEFAEAEGQLLTMLTFVAFGAAMVFPALGAATPEVVLYAILSLTVLRMLPVAVSLLGRDLMRPSYAFLGWFGPRGIASILFGLLVLEEETIMGGESIFTIVVVAVLMSVYAHGITAVPAAEAYGKITRPIYEERQTREFDPIFEENLTREFDPIEEMPLRINM